MIVDVHAHVFSDQVLQRRAALAERDEWFGRLNPPGSKRLATARRLLETMDASGVDVAVALGFGWADHALCVEQNDYLAAAARSAPGRLIAACTVQPRAGAAAVRELERAAALGCRVVGELFPDGQRFELDDRVTLGPLLDACRALNLIPLVHASEPLGREYAGKGETVPRRLLQLAQLVADVAPGLPVICAHLGGGLVFYELMPEVRALAQSLFYDTSAAAYLYDPEALTHAAQIAPGRVLFGSDYPVIGMRRMVDFVRGAGFPADAQARLFGGSAAALLNVPPTGNAATIPR
ncbi:MAG TPA: amidohydrolase family protein [Chloroflexota bacterium]|nr:amidohydrolase family protein [Chloroflexota bacterium]